MRESIHKYFKIGIIQWMSFPPGRVELLDAVKQIACDEYFDAIEVTHTEDDAKRDQLKRLIAEAHLTPCFGAQPCLMGNNANPNHLDEAERLRAEKILMDAVDEAEYIGAKAVAFLAGKWAEETRDQQFRQLVKTTVNVCRYAAGKGMQINLEVFDFDMDKAALIGPAPYAAQFAAEVHMHCNNFGLMVDLSHFPTTYETSKFVVQTVRPYISHFHIGNAVVAPGKPAYGDKHPRFGFPDSANDTNQLLDFFRVLKQEGFFCAEQPYHLSFEVSPYGDEDPQIIVANTKRVINRAWAMLED